MKKGTGGTNVGDQRLFVGNVCSRRPDSVRPSALVVSRKTRATAYITGICDVNFFLCLSLKPFHSAVLPTPRAEFALQ